MLFQKLNFKTSPTVEILLLLSKEDKTIGLFTESVRFLSRL